MFTVVFGIIVASKEFSETFLKKTAFLTNSNNENIWKN